MKKRRPETAFVPNGVYIDRAQQVSISATRTTRLVPVGEPVAKMRASEPVLLKAELFAVVGPADALYLCIDTVEVLPAGVRLLDGNACVALDRKTVYVSIATVAAAKHEILADTVDTAWLRFVESISGASDQLPIPQRRASASALSHRFRRDRR